MILHRGANRTLAVITLLILTLFVSALPLAQSSPGGAGTFVDDDGSAQEPYIEAIAVEGITTGCNPPANDRYCPDRGLTRAEMATMLVRALDFPASSTDSYADDNGSVHESAINSISAAGVTKGCNPPSNSQYCPDNELTRGQMAAFVARAFDLPPAGNSDSFADDNSSIYEGDIERLAAAGITAGCNPPANDRYCPDEQLTRGQMAVFLARALSLPILEPPPPPPPPDGSTTTTTPPGNPDASGVEVWGPRWMAGTSTVTRSRAVADARNFELLVAHEKTYEGHIAAMHAENPDLVVLTYVNAVYAEPGKWQSYPDAWFAKNKNGVRVKSTQFGNYVMDVSNSAWWNNRADKCKELINGNGYDGCFLDLLGTGPLVSGQSNVMPFNSATGQDWTYQQWMAQTIKLANRVESRVPGAVVYGNGLGSGFRYFRSSGATSQLWGGLDGMMAEVFVRSAKDGVNSYRNESMWKQDVDMLVDAANRGKTIYVTAKLWVSASSAQTNKWHEYALGTFLLGAGSDALFTFLPDQSKPTEDHAWWNIDIGSAQGKYFKTSQGLYQRNYSDGLVLVNPTGSSKTITIGSGYKNVWGNSVSSTLTVQPHTARVLTKP
ncbi:MAG: hypothetical protein DWP92_04220 [Armatimonadetes bacterium]|nr:MAG: hypothetical protein DWP92_04220 [Armatimonadota bacterium]